MAIQYSIAIRSAKPGTKSEQVTVTKAYAVAQDTETMTFAKFCEHVSEHGGVNGGEIAKVIYDVTHCLREMLLEGKRVQIDGLGTFYISLKSKGANNPSEFTAEKITKVNTRLRMASLLTSLMDDADFKFVPTRNEFKEACQKVKNQTTIGGEDSGNGGNPDDGLVVD
ncbi:MAG: HU family DNA-binding protein [Bacteroidaceae bacterium]|nr:HU family DNA-binding protein [Bacteroidaceae bacterium]